MFGAVALVLAMAASDAIAPESGARLRPLTIQVYQQDGYRRDLVRDLERALGRVSEGTGLTLSLIDCQRQGACDGRGPLDLVLVLARGSNSRPNVCGEAVIGEGRRPGRMMIVYAACIRAAAGELRGAAQLGRIATHLQFLTDSDVLGPVVLHELVHLLLPELGHGHGLMQASLRQADWAEQGPRLDTQTAQRLTAAVVARHATAHTSTR